MPSTRAARRPVGLAVLLVIVGVVGFIAAFALTLDKLANLTDPDATLTCDFSVIVQCGANLSSAQGSVFGFPNPLIGIAGFTAVTAVGVGVLAGGRFARWFWLLFNLGVFGAFVFIVWLIGQSIFVLGTLCPWCMVVWAVTIPLFLAVTLHNAASGFIPLPARLRGAARRAHGWVPLITVVCYIAVAVIAQVRLDVIRYL